nr:ROK family protein [Kibdelosporangium sp. MJ126-NF4]CEL13790.1 Predicted N-acetyl-glucosamine kinase 2, ROK family [Kibdelosporangium sp. MJ126-NF4]CTQ88158.1 Predicted N-acetyl-glucosamine kinase 2, ROK family (EC 2.7.1.59) [Kibdelosporangium sp. MJ126-NF4]
MSVVALDVGGTLMKGAVVDRDGSTRAVEQRPTPRQPDTVDGILAFAADLATAAGTPQAVGLAVPGIVDDLAGIARYSTNLGWRDLPLRDIATDRLGVPVAVTHDVRAGAIAEHEYGAARGVPDFLFLPIGTGIAGTVFTGGAPYRGADGMAGEIGHAPVPVGDEQCACGQRGCLETYASAAAVARRYGDPTLSAADVIARADTDPHARAVLDDAVSALGFALTTYTMLLDPTLIVLGGGLAEAGDTLLGPLRAQLADRLTWRTPPRLVRAELGATAGRLGAAICAWGLL